MRPTFISRYSKKLLFRFFLEAIPAFRCSSAQKSGSCRCNQG